MRNLFASLIFIGVFSLCGSVFAQKVTEEIQDGRYQMVMMEGRAIVNVRTPAMVVDRVRGIVWTCQNLQDGKPLWVKADLGKNGDKPLTAKKYLGKMLMWQDADLRMPAMVLDTEDGIVWTCQNIIDSDARWVQMDLTTGAAEGIARQKMAVIKDGEK